jgi:hypothetical protein
VQGLRENRAMSARDWNLMLGTLFVLFWCHHPNRPQALVQLTLGQFDDFVKKRTPMEFHGKTEASAGAQTVVFAEQVTEYVQCYVQYARKPGKREDPLFVTFNHCRLKTGDPAKCTRAFCAKAFGPDVRLTPTDLFKVSPGPFGVRVLLSGLQTDGVGADLCGARDGDGPGGDPPRSKSARDQRGGVSETLRPDAPRGHRPPQPQRVRGDRGAQAIRSVKYSHATSKEAQSKAGRRETRDSRKAIQGRGGRPTRRQEQRGAQVGDAPVFA